MPTTNIYIYIYIYICICVCYVCVFFLFGLVKYIFGIPKSETGILKFCEPLSCELTCTLIFLILVLPNITKILINDLKILCSFLAHVS